MKKNDFKLLGMIIVIAVLCFIAIQITKKTGASVVVTINGKEYGTYSLEKDATIEIKSEYGTNVLVIEEHKAKVVEASCPDKLCVHQRAISKTGETIVCLPHKMVVTIMNGEENETDVIVK